MKIWYLPLEAYQERYTETLHIYTARQMRDQGVDLAIVEAASGTTQIRDGRVLDASRRVITATEQVSVLAQAWDGIRDDDWIWIDDMFHPGISGIAYLIELTGKRPKVVVRNFAQSMDRFDFTATFGDWIRDYELMVDKIADLVVCASDEHSDLMRVCGMRTRIENTGLPYCKDTTLKIAQPSQEKVNAVAYSSRWDEEKQPEIFLDMIQHLPDGWVGHVFTGSAELRGTDMYAIERAKSDSRIVIHANCTKEQYLTRLSACRVHFNCALQDWVSYTLLDASTMGVPSVVPAFRSFLEFMPASQTYRPWDASHAAEVVMKTAAYVYPNTQIWSEYHSRTVERTIRIMESMK